MAKSGLRIMVSLDLSLEHGVGDKASQKKVRSMQTYMKLLIR
jgi:hypothetical protein